MNLSDADRELIALARQVRQHAYAPYSRYAVGAAVRTTSGKLFAGVNVENASYGLTICAERVAVFRAVAEGEHAIVAVAVVTPDGGRPCGACRQVLLEFAPNPAECVVWIASPDHLVARYSLEELLPDHFRLQP
ncbi:MAG: cytidine deaminase [Fimbriimonadales bacterium]